VTVDDDDDDDDLDPELLLLLLELVDADADVDDLPNEGPPNHVPGRLSCFARGRARTGTATLSKVSRCMLTNRVPVACNVCLSFWNSPPAVKMRMADGPGGSTTKAG
jgi:hypothetical protein